MKPSGPKLKKTGKKTSPLLRKRAEETLAKQKKRLQKLSSTDMEKLVHELDTHQIELEIQNEELRRAQIDLEASRARYASLYDFAPISYFTFDRYGKILAANQRGASMLGRNKRALTGASFSRFLAKAEDRETFSRHLAEVLRKTAKVECEVTVKRADGARFSAHVQSIAAEGEDGETALIRSAVSDIEERKRAELALRQSEEQFRLAIANAPIPVIMHAEDGRVLQISRTWTELTGYSIEDIMTFDEWTTHAVYGEGADKVRDHLRRIFSSSSSSSRVEFAVVTKTGELRHWSFSASVPGQLADGRRYVVGMALDITDRKRAEEEIKIAHVELERRAQELAAVNRELEAFSYTVSHDLKAPLRSIDGFARALAEDYTDKLDATGKDYLARVNAAALRMNQFIEAMLNMARLTRHELHEKIVDLSGFAEIAAHELNKQAPERTVEYVIANGLKTRGDHEMLKIVVENLLDNAWKFTSRHRAARVEFGAVKDGDKTVFFVRDDGAGFDAQYADKIFLPFKRLHAESEFPGLGIGLAMVKRIVERHGGRIWAESGPEKGATFYFTLE